MPAMSASSPVKDQNRRTTINGRDCTDRQRPQEVQEDREKRCMTVVLASVALEQQITACLNDIVDAHNDDWEAEAAEQVDVQVDSFGALTHVD
jgi:hypothetical protein